MGRMLNQNNFGDIAEDFKYWNDMSDRHKPDGSFCPLWTFQCDSEAQALKREHLQVTSISMGEKYNDLFAVGLGSLQFGHSSQGKALVYSFKNLLEPEFECVTRSGVLRVRFSPLPSHPQLLAFSCYDGVVGICDLARKTRIMTDYETEGRHIGPVWDMAWNETANLEVEQPNVISVGSDGRIVLWSVTTLNQLVNTDLLQLKSNYSTTRAKSDFGIRPSLTGEDPTDYEVLHDKAKAIEFQPIPDQNNPAKRHEASSSAGDEEGAKAKHSGNFLVATEQGWIYMCNARHRNRINSGKWKAHVSSVDGMSFNPFDAHILLTVGGDWSVKVWKLHTIRLCPLPSITIHMTTSARDAVWTSYSSTCFTAVTHDRHILFYNLAESRSHPVKTQAVVGKRSHTTRVLLSHKDPVALVGDSKGEVSVLKLSPNLRKQWVCDNLVKKKSAADKEREKANLENEKAVQQEKFDNEKKLLVKVLALDENYSVHEAEEKGVVLPERRRRRSSTGTRRESKAGLFVGRRRSKSKSISQRRRSTSVSKRSQRASSISRQLIRSKLKSVESLKQ
ncbi:dynein axonemal intermediate chain 1-like [Symsagittifera roscoffensis]|uniref:dynein axonemal intermediate chain 1-like n=1 Tax=Symsagittifera roscoffensis TaxID=84072 RepID=UPI00307BAD12